MVVLLGVYQEEWTGVDIPLLANILMLLVHLRREDAASRVVDLLLELEVVEDLLVFALFLVYQRLVGVGNRHVIVQELQGVLDEVEAGEAVLPLPSLYAFADRLLSAIL